MRIASNPPWEVDWKQSQPGCTIIYYLCKVHEIFGLLVGLACGASYIAIFCSALVATFGKKEACFMMAE